VVATIVIAAAPPCQSLRRLKYATIATRKITPSNPYSHSGADPGSLAVAEPDTEAGMALAEAVTVGVASMVGDGDAVAESDDAAEAAGVDEDCAL